jgi:transcriptional regulator with XRE-family HTH domain
VSVPAKRGPTLRAHWLGQQLRDLRDEAGLTLKEVADHLQRDPSTISRMEQGIHPARVPDVLAYVEVCGLTDERRRAELVRLARGARTSGWWERYGSEFSEKLIDRIWLETNGREIHSFQTVVLPGLLQTSAYAESLIGAARTSEPDEWSRRAVDLRLDRQRALDPLATLRLHAVLDESVLHRVVGGPAVMRAQLDHLLEAASSNVVTLAILPWSAGAHASPEGNFEILVMEEPYPDVGYIDVPNGSIYVEGKDVELLHLRFERLVEAALDPAESVGRILSIARELGE